MCMFTNKCACLFWDVFYVGGRHTHLVLKSILLGNRNFFSLLLPLLFEASLCWQGRGFRALPAFLSKAAFSRCRSCGSLPQTAFLSSTFLSCEPGSPPGMVIDPYSLPCSGVPLKQKTPCSGALPETLQLPAFKCSPDLGITLQLD